MNRQVRVPIRVRRSDGGSRQEERERQRPIVESQPAVAEPQPAVAEKRDQRHPKEDVGSWSRQEETADQARREEIEALKEDVETWRDRALRLQAEIENFRKRQRRLAEDRIEADRGRLLRNFLMIADDLERALNAEGDGNGALREGVEVTHRSLKQMLRQEGVEPIRAEGEVFDPAWHEAVGTVPHEQVGVAKDTVVDVTQTGYRLDGRLLRPSRVIVAK